MPRRVSIIVGHSIAYVLAVSAIPGSESMACAPTTTAAIVALQISQPLLDTPEVNDGFLLRVFPEGCVRVRYPAWDVRAGEHAFRLRPDEFIALREALARTGIAAFQAARVRSELGRRKAVPSLTASRVTISDAEAVRLTLVLPVTPTDVVVEWSGLREQRMEFPDHPGLAALEASIGILRRLEDDARLAPVAE